MNAITLHGLLAIFFLNFLFSHALSDVSPIESRVPVIFGYNGTLTPLLNSEWTHYELLKREDTWTKALSDGQDFVNKLNGAREESPWSTVEQLKVRVDLIPKRHGKHSDLGVRTQVLTKVQSGKRVDDSGFSP